MSQQFFMVVLVGAIGIVSSFLYWRQRLWISAGAVLIAATSLIFLLVNFPLLKSNQTGVVIDGDTPSLNQIEEMQGASKIIVHGDGLRAAQWRDLPSRPLEWTAPLTPSLHLDFPRQLALGRMLVINANLQPEVKNWRLQLLAENGEILAESDKSAHGLERSVAWLPPAAEALVLHARVLDENGKILDQGSIPVIVQDNKELQVIGRFGAPSFDTLALNNLLVTSKANLDWQVDLGKGITRRETARSSMTTPQVTIIDASYFEKLNVATRNSLMAQVAAGMPLIILASNVSQPAIWASALDLPLLATPASANKEDQVDVTPDMVLTSAQYLPASKRLGAWTANRTEKPWLWQRPWQAGRIVWIGVADWHRYAISSPLTLSNWWQSILDLAQINAGETLVWTTQEEMPLVSERTAICVQGLSENEVQIAQTQQSVPVNRRSNQVDAKCAAIWPQVEGWQIFKAAGGSHAIFVYGKTAWPLWQRTLKRQATHDYASRLPAPAISIPDKPFALWPFAVLFALSMLMIWWQDRR